MSINITNKIAIIAILLISLFGMNLEEGKAQAPCESGYTSISYNILINGCYYQALFCYKCSPNAYVATDVKGPLTYFKINPNCNPNPALTDQQIKDLLLLKGKELIWAQCEVRPCDEEPKATMLVKEYACYEKSIVGSNTIISACLNSAYCETLYEACNNGSSIVWTVVSTTFYNNSDPQYDCEPNDEGDFPPFENEETSTGCIRFNTKCDE
jgi:hypothetical protein